MEAVKNTKKPNIIEMAKKKRHLFLLEKMQKGKALTRAEIRELGKYEGGQLPPGIIETQSGVAKAFNVRVRTVERWRSEGMPVMQDGNYNIAGIQAWRLLKGDKKYKEAAAEDLKEWDAKYRQFKARLAEVEYKKRIGKLIPLDEVESGRVYRIIAIKQKLLGLPQMIAPQLAGLEPRQIYIILDARIKEIIEEFSRPNEINREEKERVVKSGTISVEGTKRERNTADKGQGCPGQEKSPQRGANKEKEPVLSPA